MDKLISTLEKIIHPINKIAGLIAAILLFFMMILTFSDVAGRYFFRPVTDAYEITEFMLALAVFLGIGYTQIHKEHISIDFIVNKFSNRTQGIIEMIIYGTAIIFLTVMAWQTFVFAERSMGITAGRLQLPESVFIFICAFGIIVFVLTFLIDFLKSLQKAVLKNNES